MTRNGNSTAYSITSWAVASKGLGKVRPSVLALLRLIAHDRRGCFQGYSGRARGEVARQILTHQRHRRFRIFALQIER